MDAHTLHLPENSLRQAGDSQPRSHDGFRMQDDSWSQNRTPYRPSTTSYPVSPSPPQPAPPSQPGMLDDTWNHSQMSYPGPPSVTPSPSLPPSRPVSQSLAPVFVDNTARSLNLRAEQISHLKILYKLGLSQTGLSVPELTIAIYSAALQLASENRILSGLHDILTRAGVLQAVAVDNNDQSLNVWGILKELKIRLEDSFRFTKEQLKNLRILTQMQIYKHSRISFKELHVDVEAKIFESKDLYNMGNIVGNPAREHQLTSEAKRKASHVRNQFCTDLKKSVVGLTACSLEEFSVRCASKYRAGISAAADQKYIIRNALLRRFAYENKEYLDLNERVTASSSSDDEGEAAGEEDDEFEDVESVGTGKKRKRGAKKVKSDYWALSDQWFCEEMKTRGTELTDPRWRSYIDETIRRDKVKFPGNSGLSTAASSATQSAEVASSIHAPTSGGSAHAVQDGAADSDATQALFASAGIY